MAGRDGIRGNNQSRNAKVRRRRVVIMGGAVGAFLAAAAMATGSAVTAAPAKPDFEDLLDPIIQPVLTTLTDSLAGFDPAAAVDVTSWTDSLLSSLNSIDLALPSTAESAAAAAASPASDPTSGAIIPLGLAEDTEPTVQATVDGANTTLLVDTGSSGLVIPYTDLGSNILTQLESLLELGLPTGIGESGYSGGVDYIYLTYDNATVDYGGVLTTTNTPIDVEILSWPTSLSSPSSFQDFLGDNDVTGILGIGDNTAGPTTSPLESYGGVLVDVPGKELIVDPTNPGTAYATLDGAPTSNLTESINGGPPVAVSDDIDSGGVYGTIPSTLESGSSVPPNTTITVFDGTKELYSYVTGTDTDGTSTSPTVVSGTDIDSGVIPYLEHPIFIDYTNDTLSFDDALS
jgi:PE-PGRS C-terminal aspartyl peptidase-like domain